ncbi:MAG: hypothetical protein F4120_06700 [Rhodothermaceae bacterium]|nr:hypothetical protein [Bacteroidota bacterium]MXW14406.1 hypothetical protein [Rhodothermaceae bacterium]MXW32337.1 hypothetical protein [Rhodothermaceae bacterium]MYC03184.1 hypothetical protein [Rhodothermaceae bacterium]MYE63577.1 hypothetical protein [Rhodothermaceae bacterium]
MKKNKFVGRLILPVIFPLIPFRMYWSEFDGAYTDMDLLWGGIVAVALGVAIFRYEPLAKRIEHFSPAWFFVLFIFLGLLGFGIILSDLYFPLPYRAWGNYAVHFAILMPGTHQIFHYAGKKHQKGSFYKRMRLTPTDQATE